VRITSQNKDERHEIKKPISAREYMMLLDNADPEFRTLKKERISFVYEKQSFILDIILNAYENRKLKILRIEAPKKGSDVRVPPFFKISREVTGDVVFNTYNMAKKE